MLPISVCIIAKNEEKHIEKCLHALSCYDWEIVVVDTGSTDATVELAKKYTSQVFHFTWCDDFSAAKNYAASKAQNDWILSLDCDEYLINKQSQRDFQQEMKAILDYPQTAGVITLQNPHANDDEVSIEHVTRLYHKTYYAFQGTVHEQLVLNSGISVKEASYVHVPIWVFHDGYSDANLLKEKANRNIALLKKEIENHPTDPYLYFQLGQSYYVQQVYDLALEAFDKGLSFDVNPELGYVQTMVESFGYCLLHLKQAERALSLEGVYDAFCQRADFCFLMGLIYMNNGLFEQAIQELERATTCTEYTVSGINSYLAYYNMGVIYEVLGQVEQARKNFEKSLEYKDYEPAKAGLIRLRK